MAIRLIHFSDIHVWSARGWDGDLGFKRILGRVNLFVRRRYCYPPEWGRRVVQAILEREADAVVFSGDLSTAALIEEFEMGRALLAPLREKWGERFIAIPGNHDRYTRRSSDRALFEHHAMGAGVAYPFSVSLGPELALVGIDVSVPRMIRSLGHLSAEGVERAACAVAAARRDAAYVAVVGHYPLAYSPGVAPGWQHALPRRETLVAALAEAGASLYLHGHKHRRWAVSAAARDGKIDARPWRASQSEEPGRIVCVNPGSAGLRSADPMRAAGFAEIAIEAGRVAAIEATVLRIDSDGQFATERFSLGAQTQT